MSLFRTSFEFTDAPRGVVEVVVFDDAPKADLLKVVGVDPAKVAKDRDRWVVQDLAYMPVLEELLESKFVLSGTSPYARFLLAPPPPHDESDVIDWTSITQQPFDYQKEAVTTAIRDHSGRSIVALKPGSGKTMIGVLFMHHFLALSGGSALVICPASVSLNWMRDYARITKCSTQAVRAMTYEFANRRAVDSPSMFNKFSVIVVDECHHLKNGDTCSSENLTPIIHRAKHVLLLSATPQLNRNSELFNQFHLVRPDVFADKKTFTQRFSGGHVNRAGVWDDRGSDLLWELNFLAKKVMFKKDVVTTTMIKRRHRIYTVPTPEQMIEQAKYTKERSMLAAKLARATPQEYHAAKRRLDALITKMHRVAGVWKSTNALSAVKDIINKHPGAKFAFFADQIKVAKAFKSGVDALRLGESAMLTGASSATARANCVDRMARKEDPLRFGFFTPCMKEGVTMSPGTTVSIMLEIGWTPSDMRQKEDRIYRINTVEPVDIYWLFCLNSYDDEAFDKIQSKAAEIESVLEEKCDFEFDSEVKPELPRLPQAPKKRKVKRARVEPETPLLVPIDIEI